MHIFFRNNTQQREVRRKKLVSAHNTSLINSGASAKPKRVRMTESMCGVADVDNNRAGW